VELQVGQLFMYEIEAKLKVDSLNPVREKLAKVGAVFVEERLQKDSYFDFTDDILSRGDRGLRLRRQLAGQNEKVILTYKGVKEENKFKKRQEIEVEVGSGDSAEGLLLAVGFEKKLVVEKKRQVWRLKECEIALDEVTMLGNFIEIEGPNEDKIADVQKILGLEDSKHIKHGYSHLLRKKLNEFGKD
jgi:adenylate cyclase, class 2